MAHGVLTCRIARLLAEAIGNIGIEVLKINHIRYRLSPWNLLSRKNPSRNIYRRSGTKCFL